MAGALLFLCRFRPLVEVGTRAAQWAATPQAGILGVPLLWAVRRTAFRHFCGGESLEECIDAASHLAASRVRCIVDWSIEEDENEASWDVNAQRKVEVLHKASAALGHNAAFVPIKLTALVSPSLLERITRAEQDAPGPDAAVGDPSAGLSADDARLVEEALARLAKICEAARDCGVPVLCDAEQSARQPAVHLLARQLQRRFNAGGAVVVYDTLQMYLQSSPRRLQGTLEAARVGGYTFAVKLVRGAYVEQEQLLGTVHPSKEATDAAYDAAVTQLLEAVAFGRSSSASVPAAAVLLATHNRVSLERSVAEMDRLGMVDNLSNALGVAGYNATKLVVFGDMREVLPWLMRRVQENRDAFGAQASELPVLHAELRRRLRLGSGG